LRQPIFAGARKICARITSTRLRVYARFRASEESRDFCAKRFSRETQCYNQNKWFFPFYHLAHSIFSGFSDETAFFVRTGPWSALVSATVTNKEH
jgi:hypothetical protein